MRFLTRNLPILLLLFMAACTGKNKVSLVETNAKGEIPSLGNLTFLFNKNLAPDSLLNEWDTTEYIHFEPALAGRFRWNNPNELVFSPEAELPPATAYKARFTEQLLRWHKEWRIESRALPEFHTAMLRLDNALAMWNVAGGNAENAYPQIDLYFNYKIAPAKIKELIRIEVDGSSKKFTLQSTAADQKISLSLQNIPLEDKDLQVTVKLSKGIIPEGGNSPTTEAMESNLVIPSPFNVQIQNLEAQHDGSIGTVKVFMSQIPIADGLTSFIQIDPPVKFKAEAVPEGLVLTSADFDVAKVYSLTIAKGLRGRIGGTLKEEYNNNISFGKLAPSISFVNSKGVYLSSKGNKNIEVQITSVKRIKVVISKIYESNLLAAESRGYYNPNGDYYNESDEGGDFSYDDEGYAYSSEVLGDVIYEKEIDTKDLPRIGSNRLFTFNFQDKLKEFKGIYHIRIRSTEDYWLSDSRFVSLSDLGLIAKSSKNTILVFANSIKSAAAVDGARISVYGYNNQLIGTGLTNKDGVAKVSLKERSQSGFRPAMITATTPTDFNYMPFNAAHVNTSRFDVGGKRTNATGLDVFVYSGRDIYRPGEKVDFSVVVRDWQWNKPGELPLKIKLLLPNGKELKTIKKSLNTQGSLETQVDLSPSAVTGSYAIEVYSANDVLIATKSFLVEEFMPDRIKVTTATDKKTIAPGEQVALSINAVNLFGPPAADRKYEVEIQTKEKRFNPKKYSQYDFSLSEQGTYYESVVNEGITDKMGNASLRYKAPEEYRGRGLMQVDFFTTVFDETGRPVNRKSSVDIYTQDVFYGIATDGYAYYPLNRNISFPVIALNKAEQPINTKAHVQVVKHDYRTYLSRDGGYFRYDSRREDKVVFDREINVSGEQAKFDFIPQTPGEYEVRIAAPGGSSYVKNEFYSYGLWGNVGGNFEVNREGNITIELDKNLYYTNENARVLFKTPFNGKMLVTVETDKVIDYRYITVENRSASLSLNLKADYLPNAYITATLIKPHAESDMPLTVAHGFKPISVAEKSRKIPVEIVAATKVRSRTRQTVRVKATPYSKVTLAAVDEGILQMTDFKTPDPYGFFYGKRALAVNSFDLYPLLFPELRGLVSSTGGDGFDLSKRTNPIQSKRVNLVSYWSGIVTANGSGEANFEFDVPQFSGQLRLMAVAYKDAAFGSSEAKMTVADPLVLSTALPRFLAPGDVITMPVTVSNTTATEAVATLSAKSTGPLQIEEHSTQKVTVKANSEVRVLFKVSAKEAIGAGKISVEAQGLKEKFLEETEISVRPAASLQKKTGEGVIAGGSSAEIHLAEHSFIPATADYQLVIGKSPIVELSEQIFYLLQYPYGCTEQIISAAFPQLYFADLSDLMNINPQEKANANYHVQEAIRKIRMRQLYNGALMLWDNEDSENWWTTAYGTHFLLEAQKAGFEVDSKLLDNLYAYLISRLRSRGTINYIYNRNQQKKIAPKEVAYSLYVLAIAGKPQVSTMNYYKENQQLLALDSRYLLSAAFAIAGDKGKFKELLPNSFSGEVAGRETGGSFYSDIRDEAVALNAILEVDPGNTQVGVMAKHLSAALKSRTWLSTQERAFSLLALGKVAHSAVNTQIKAVVKVGGKQVAVSDGSTLRLSTKQLGGTEVTITTTGTGKLYYYWQAEGISEDGSFREEDRFIRVRKKFYDRYGREITGNTFKQNDLIVVGITLENAYSNPIDNIVISDMLPAGFEIENPRIKEVPGMSWIKDESHPTQMDVRDDRINLFVHLGSVPQRYYYAVRAVSLGKFNMGPVMADAMYNGEYHSYNGNRIIQIVP